MIDTPFRSRRVASATFATALLCLAAIGAGSASAKRQFCTSANCKSTPVNVTGPQLQPLMDHTGTCSKDGVLQSSSTVTDGGFVKLNSDMKQGAEAHLTGQCINRGCSGANCVTFFTQDRTIFAVWLGWINPNGQFSPSNFNLQNLGPNGTVYLQSIDSRIAGSTNGPVNRRPNIEGTWSYRYWVQSTVTNCNIQPANHPEERVNVNVAACRPEWWVDGANNVRPPDGDITISVPLGMDDIVVPLQQAVQSWAGVGRTINVIPNYTCPVGDGRCVRLDQTHTGSGCAVTSGPWDSATGLRNGASLINIPPNWRNAHTSRVASDLAHELGHVLGLDDMNHSSCSCGNTTMGVAPSTVCVDPTPLPTSCAPGATPTDVLALTQSTYGNGNRNVCGW